MDNTLENASVQQAALVMVLLNAFTTPLMLSATNVALPTIAEDLNLDAVLLGWVPMAFFDGKRNVCTRLWPHRGYGRSKTDFSDWYNQCHYHIAACINSAKWRTLDLCAILTRVECRHALRYADCNHIFGFPT